MALKATKVTALAQPEPLVATVQLDVKIVKIGGKDFRQPVTVDIAKKSDLKMEYLLGDGGRRKPQNGDQGVDCFMFVDGQRLTFDVGEDGKLVKVA
jgi:hypothetical protein